MKQYRVTAYYTVYCYATIEASNEDEAYEIVRDMDGGDFEPEDDFALNDWHIDSVKEIITPK